MNSLDAFLYNNFGYEAVSEKNYTLDRIKIAIERIAFHSEFKAIVTIAGTNGKGQTSHNLASMLKSKNQTYALWTSPHIHSVCERFQSHYSLVSESELMHLFEDTFAKVSDLKLSYFEFLFVVFLQYAQKLEVNYLLLEVGLGGRLDATNALDADIAVLTSISRDHQEVLGPRYDLILQEKLGITRKGKILVSHVELDYLKARVRQHCLEHQIECHQLDNAIHFQQANLESAQKVMQLLGFDDIESEPYYANQHSFHYQGCSFKSFGAHNPDGVRKLVQYLQHENYNFSSVVLSFSKRSLKDYDSMLGTLLKSFDRHQISLVAFDHFKALDKSLLKGLADKFGVSYFEHFEQFFSKAPSSKEILVMGSYYFVAELRKFCSK